MPDGGFIEVSVQVEGDSRALWQCVVARDVTGYVDAAGARVELSDACALTDRDATLRAHNQQGGMS